MESSGSEGFWHSVGELLEFRERWSSDIERSFWGTGRMEFRGDEYFF